MTGLQCSGDGPDKREITRGVQGIFRCALQQSHRWDAASIGEKRKTQRGSERVEKATHGVVTSATAQGFMKMSLEIPRAKTTSDVSSAIQMLEELVRKCEEHRDKKYDNDLKLQRLYDILPKPIEQQSVLEDTDESATYESVKRRANTWILVNSTGRANMDLGTAEHGGDNKDDDGRQDRDSSGDMMGLKGGKGNKERDSTMDTATSADSGRQGKELRVDGDSVLQLWTVVTYMSKSCPEKGRGRREEERGKRKEERRKGKGRKGRKGRKERKGEKGEKG